jgi:Tol biopolymer transport system component
MKKSLSTVFYTLLSLCLFACSVELDQPTQTEPTPTSKTVDITPTANANNANTPPTGPTRPVTWAGLNLTGRLVYIRRSSNNDVSVLGVEILDLVNGAIDTIFTAEEDSAIYYASASPASNQLIISFTPPSSAGSLPNQALYILPMDGSAPPQLFVTPPTESDQYIQAEWSPDGKYIYFVHTNYQDRPAGQTFPTYEIFRMAYPDGQSEKIVENALWPRLSSDSSKLVYVTEDPVSGQNELFFADANGTNPQQIKLTGDNVSDVIDTPLFSPDGQMLFFSAPDSAESYQPNWFEKLTGIFVAKAHDLRSDWWSVPITGGEPTRLTQIQSINLFGSLSPDQKHMVSFSLDGLFVMDLDGSNLTSLFPDPGGSTVNWIP